MISTYKDKHADIPSDFPAQHQNQQPGSQKVMDPYPETDNPNYFGSGKLKDKIAIITGGDSGIGQAVAIAFAKEGAELAIGYLNQKDDAKHTVSKVEYFKRKCVDFQCDLQQEKAAFDLVDKTIAEFGRIDVIINNIAVQYPQSNLTDITAEQWNRTFATNVASYFYLTKAALPHLKSGASIINTTSVTAYTGHKSMIDYSATKGAIVSFTRSLALQLAGKGIRVNAVAPGPVWTPLITSSFSAKEVDNFGKDVPLGRAAQPFEIAPTYVYLACDDSAYVTGQVLHVNGGTMADS